MTLRVRLEVVPFGDEDRAYEIGRLDIFNKGKFDQNGLRHEYGVLDLGDEPGMFNRCILHIREDGAWTLVRDVLETLEIKGP